MNKTKRKPPEQTTTISDIMKEIMVSQEITQAKMADDMGFKTQSGISERLRGDIRIKNLLNMLEYLGCELVVREKGEDGKEWVIEKLEK